MRLSIKSDAKQLAAKINKLSSRLSSEAAAAARKELEKRIQRLRGELEFLVNEYPRVPDTNQNISAQPLAQRIAEEQALGKSRAVNKGDDFHTSFDSPVYKAALVNGGNNYAMRVRDSSIHPDASYQDYVDSFTDTLKDKVFAIQDETSGSYRYYIIPPGSLLMDEVLDDVKIFCSEYTDQAGRGRDPGELNDDGEPLRDIGKRKGEAKFARDKEKGHTEFTLKERALLAIKERGTDVTNIVLNTQHGEYESAYALAKQVDSPAMKAAQEKALDAMEGKGVSPEAQALAKTNKAVQNITVVERSSKDSTQFLIKALIDDREFISEQVLHAIKREVLVWSTELEGPIKTALAQAFERAISELKGA
jgi:hypothetical protein